MLSGKDPDPIAEEAMDKALILHADHELNASTFTARVPGYQSRSADTPPLAYYQPGRSGSSALGLVDYPKPFCNDDGIPDSRCECGGGGHGCALRQRRSQRV